MYWQWRRRAIARFTNMTLAPYLMPEASKGKHVIKFALLLLAFVFLIVGWANPQWGSQREKVTRKGIDLFVILDISTSMLAEDVPPNRLERAKKFGEDLVEGLKGERMGLILLAGNAYLQVPITTDYNAMQTFIRSANVEQAGTQGSDIGDAFTQVLRYFDKNSPQHKAVILISDGEDHEGEAVAKAQEVADAGIAIFTVGVGTEKGGAIPISSGRRQDFKRDPSGKPIRTLLDQPLLEELATTGNGAYFPISQESKVAAGIRERIDNMEKKEFEERSFERYESYFQWFLGIALLILVAEFLVTYQKSKWMQGKDIFG